MGNSHKLPSGWKRIKLGEYLTEISDRNNTIKDNGAPVLSVTNRPGFSISEEHFYKKVFSKDLSNYKIIKRGQFAYNPSRVNVGSIARLKEVDKGLLSPMYVTFETKMGLNESYLDHWILSPRFRSLVKAGTQGSVRNSLNFSALADFPFYLPPDEEQKKIVEILDRIDLVIDQTQAIIDQTQTLKKGLIQELFTRGIPSKKKKFIKSELGEIPEKWQILRFENIVADYRNGIYKHERHYGAGVPCIRMYNIFDGKVNTRNTPLVKASKKELVDYGLLPGDILINRVNSLDQVGKAGIVREDLGPAVFESKNIRVRTDGSKCLPEYLITFLSSSLYLRQMKRGIKAAVQQATINQDDLNRIKISLPQIEEQQVIINLMQKIDLDIQINQTTYNFYHEVKSAIMQVLLTGEVRIKK
ncbi:MAG: restriction endonuclease subunit S [Candidatus Omnitrophota bacterium]